MCFGRTRPLLETYKAKRVRNAARRAAACSPAGDASVETCKTAYGSRAQPHALISGILCLMLSATAAAAQTRIGDWMLQEEALSQTPDVYSIGAHSGDPRSPSSATVGFYCDHGIYKFSLLPPAGKATGRNDLSDGSWRLTIFIDSQAGIVLSGQSSGGAISAPISREQMTALASVRPRGPVGDVLTAMIEKTDGGRIQRSINFPATRFKAAIAALADICGPDR